MKEEIMIDTTHTGQLKSVGYAVAPAVASYLTTLGIKDTLIYGLFIMMLLDIISGIIMWLRIDASKIKSSVFKKGMSEKFMSLMPAAVIFVILLSFDSNAVILLNSYLSILILAEGYSAISNAHCAYTKEYKEEYDAVSAALKWVKNKMLKTFKALLKDK